MKTIENKGSERICRKDLTVSSHSALSVISISEFGKIIALDTYRDFLCIMWVFVLKDSSC